MVNIRVAMSLCVEVSPIINITTAVKIKPTPQLYILLPGASLSLFCASDPHALRVVYTFGLFLGISVLHHNIVMRK